MIRKGPDAVITGRADAVRYLAKAQRTRMRVQRMRERLKEEPTAPPSLFACIQRIESVYPEWAAQARLFPTIENDGEGMRELIRASLNPHLSYQLGILLEQGNLSADAEEAAVLDNAGRQFAALNFVVHSGTGCPNRHPPSHLANLIKTFSPPSEVDPVKLEEQRAEKAGQLAQARKAVAAVQMGLAVRVVDRICLDDLPMLPLPPAKPHPAALRHLSAGLRALARFFDDQKHSNRHRRVESYVPNDEPAAPIDLRTLRRDRLPVVFSPSPDGRPTAEDIEESVARLMQAAG